MMNRKYMTGSAKSYPDFPYFPPGFPPTQAMTWNRIWHYLRTVYVCPAETAKWESRGAGGVVRALRDNAPKENRWLNVLS